MDENEFYLKLTEDNKKKYNECCEHMQSLIMYCVENKVFFDGCGDCGSPWLVCKLCNKDIYYMNEFWEDFNWQ